MCGIWFYLSRTSPSHQILEEKFNTIQPRGPDFSILKKIDETMLLGFHRLSIMDPSESGNQPFFKNNIYAVCNGEIYNYRELRSLYQIDTVSDSDCEVIIPLYQKFGIRKLHELFDGVFSIILVDLNIQKVFTLRDRVGVRGLFISHDDTSFGVSSEAKGLIHNIVPQPPQFIYELDIKTHTVSTYPINIPLRLESPISPVDSKIRSLFIESVEKRMMSDRPVCSLLSGGLDSSIVSSVASKYCKTHNTILNTFSIGFEKNATDLKYAQMVADFIESNHTEVIISFKDAISALDDVIYTTETFDVTTIRASTGQYLLSKYISENTPFKVVLSGDGSDELMGGYLYSYHAPTADDLNKETLRLVEELHKYDVLRVDRCVSRWGLEARVPFLDKKFVDYFFSVSAEFKTPQRFQIEKGLFRKAFDTGEYLPKDVLFRKKEAFSDGVSSVENSWHTVLQKHIETLVTDQEYNENKGLFSPVPTSKEAYYYRTIYERHYNPTVLVDYYWVPKWSNTNEPSARELRLYHD
jgi:asparagine synthase (glutamine-hydrolysing)